MQLVIHSPYGSRINRAWGLALRKRFCRKFNFELQAAATEDNIVLSLTTAHSFELAEVARYLHSATHQAVADPGAAGCADVHHALALGDRRRACAAAFPRRPEGGAAARADGRGGPDRRGFPRPDRLCREPGRRARDPGPSAGAPDHHRLPQRGDGHRRPGTAAAPDRIRRHPDRRPRSDRAVATGARGARGAALRLSRRRAAGGAPDPGGDEPALALAGRLRPISAGSMPMRSRAFAPKRGPMPPTPTSCTMRWSGSALSPPRKRRRATAGATGWRIWRGKSAWRGSMHLPRRSGSRRSACRSFAALWPAAKLEPAIAAPEAYCRTELERDEALVEVLRGRLEGLGPVDAGCARGAARTCGERDRRRPGGARGRGLRHARALHARRAAEEWCERRLLARIHAIPSSACGRRSSRSRRATSCASFSPGSASRRMRAWRGRTRSTPSSGSSKASRRRPAPGRPRSCRRVSPATSRPGSTIAAWPGRSRGHACGRGRPIGQRTREWRRRPRRAGAHDADHAGGAPPRRALGIAVRATRMRSSPARRAQAVADHIRQHGASFFDELVEGTGLLRSQVEEALAELVALGIVTLGQLRRACARCWCRRASADPCPGGRRRRRTAKFGMEAAGRWALVRRPRPAAPHRSPTRPSRRRRSSTSRARC